VLQTWLGFSDSNATTYAGQWVAFQANESGYQQVADGVTLSSALAQATPSAPLRLTMTSTREGRRVVGLIGGLPSTVANANITGTEVLYVSDQAPYLPVEFQYLVTPKHDVLAYSTSGTFSNWGEDVVVTAPSSYVPISSISSSGE